MKADAWCYGPVLCEREGRVINMVCVDWADEETQTPCRWKHTALNVIEARLRGTTHSRTH